MHYAPIRSQLMTPFSEPIIMQAYFIVRKGSFHPEGYIIRRMMQDPRTDLIRSSRDLVCSDRKICRALPNWVNILSGQSSRRAGIATQEQTDSAPRALSVHFLALFLGQPCSRKTQQGLHRTTKPSLLRVVRPGY